MTTFGMTDQNRVAAILQAVFSSTATGGSLTAGTGGGSGFAISPPYHLRLMTTAGSNTVNGTEATGSTCPGYTSGFPSGGLSLGSSAFGSFTSGASSNGTLLTWTATGTWTLGVAGIEVWDSASTAVRYLWGPLSTAIGASVVISGDTISFAIGAVGASGASW